MEKIRQNYVKIGIPDSAIMLPKSLEFLEEAGFHGVTDLLKSPTQLWAISDWKNKSIVLAEIRFMPEVEVYGRVASQELNFGIVSDMITRANPELKKKISLATHLPPFAEASRPYYFFRPALIEPMGMRKLDDYTDELSNSMRRVLGKFSTVYYDYEYKNRPQWMDKYDR